MLEQLLKPKEKKVEYIELIYDLIFVYIIGRNNSLLHNFSNGFVDIGFFLAYVMTTLAIIQIWNYTTYYINVYGRHGVRDHVFLFINMFLLYFIGEGTRADWHAYHTQYHIAWALILVNIAVQYLIEIRNHPEVKEKRRQMKRMAGILITEALIVVSDIPIYRLTGKTYVSLVAIVFGMGTVIFFGQKMSGNFVDFPHLSERAMLYVVFTFGEMIIAIASYFEGDFSVRSTYFALMAFLIVVGLFLSYGVFYDHIVDREMNTNGLLYIFLHIFIIFAMNNITNGLEFMREDEIRLLPKMLFLMASFALYFLFVFALGNRHARARCRQYNILCLKAAAVTGIFVVLILVLRNQMEWNIALSAVFSFAMFIMLYRYGKKMDTLEG